MATLTPNLGLSVPSVGGDVGPAFANELNGDLGILDNALCATNTIDISGKVNVTATATQAQSLIQNLVGTITGNIIYFLPKRGGFWAIQNNTTGNFLVTVGVTGGSNVLSVPQGSSVWVWSDGSTIRNAAPPQQPQVISGWVQTSSVVLSNAPNLVAALSSSYRRYRLTLQGVTASAPNTNPNIVLSRDGGQTLMSGIRGLGVLQVGQPPSSAANYGGSATNFPALQLFGITMRGDGRVAGDVVMELFPGSPTQAATGRLLSSCDDGTNFAAYRLEFISNDIGAVNYLRVNGADGLLSGTAILEGFP